MGNDGGSIPDRRDLVRTKAKAERADKNNQTIARWFFCALSKLPLQEPVVSCALGKIYNKDSVLEYLLDKSLYGDGAKICGHVRTLKDVKTLKLTRNPAAEGSDSDNRQARFACPLTLKEMNGLQPFVYIATCGCVFSQAGLRSVLTSSPPDTPEEPQQDSCPQCSTPFSPSKDIFVLNPSEEEEEKMRTNMEAKRAAAQLNSKSKKRKAVDVPTSELPPPQKRIAQTEGTGKVAPITNHATATSKSVAEALALAEKTRKSTMSDAVKSLYASNGKQAKETFMTRTFTRSHQTDFLISMLKNLSFTEEGTHVTAVFIHSL
ncbi:hypothetical protein Clacol_002242 [Clathrus columnatus]|uniref:Replication termination factor 2 n=1 Tax=Clathrus columnatus TaxID=1419009 RepID=A0AAV5A806_9AGAM|nr:hypothetical protein Clacol_002242 [Clathrus columnatus]